MSRPRLAAMITLAVCLLATGCSTLDVLREPTAQRDVQAAADLLKHGDTGGATAKFDALVRQNPDEPVVYRAIAAVCIQARQPDLAVRYAQQGFDRLRAAAPPVKADLAATVAAAYLLARDGTKALQWARKAQALNGADPMVANSLAYTEAEMPDVDTPEGEGRLGEADRLARDAIAKLREQHADDEQMGQVVDTLGWIQYRQRLYPAAIETLTRAVDLAPGEADIWYHLGMAYAAAGRTAEARTAFQRSLQADAMNAAAREALRQLDPAPAPSSVPRPAPNPLSANPPVFIEREPGAAR